MGEQSAPPHENDSNGSGPSSVADRPKTIKELYAFYYDRFKPLYNLVSADNQVPFELLVEAVAAMDHVSRFWQYGQSESSCVDRATAHLKRGAFDAFKLLLKQTIDDYKRLSRVDTSIIDNGEFDRRLAQLIREIRTGAVHARSSEGDCEEDWHRAFAIWEGVYSNCRRFYDSFYHHERVPWARRRQWIARTLHWGMAAIIALVMGVTVQVVKYWWFGK